VFLEAHRRAPRQIILDLDATDDPLHGHQEGRFFHGYYDCYCYLPLYIFSGRHLLAAKLRRSNIDASAGAVEEVARIARRTAGGGDCAKDSVSVWLYLQVQHLCRKFHQSRLLAGCSTLQMA
jgi:Transposase DDE domain group 1